MTSMPPPRPRAIGFPVSTTSAARDTLLEILVVLPIIPGHRLLISPTAMSPRYEGKPKCCICLGGWEFMAWAMPGSFRGEGGGALSCVTGASRGREMTERSWPRATQETVGPVVRC